jgi:hypothetical protein
MGDAFAYLWQPSLNSVSTLAASLTKRSAIADIETILNQADKDAERRRDRAMMECFTRAGSDAEPASNDLRSRRSGWRRPRGEGWTRRIVRSAHAAHGPITGRNPTAVIAGYDDGACF